MLLPVITYDIAATDFMVVLTGLAFEVNKKEMIVSVMPSHPENIPIEVTALSLTVSEH